MIVEPDVEQSHLTVTYQRITVVKLHAFAYRGLGKIANILEMGMELQQATLLTWQC
jgi:hypothetical protein